MAKLTVQFSRKMNTILQEMADRKGTTKVDILRRAVALYKYLTNEVKLGNRVAWTQGDRIIAEINLP